MASELFPLVILAGGKGDRAGGPKGLMKVDGHYWLESQLKAYASLGGKKAIVVLGWQFQDYFKNMPWLSAPESFLPSFDLKIVVNRNPELGQFSSVKGGLGLLSTEADSTCFVMPVDMPIPEASTWQQLVSALQTPIRAVVPVYQGQGGHPVLLHSEFSRHLAALDPESRLDVQIHSLPAGQCVYLEVHDSKVVKNFNHAEDWK